MRGALLHIARSTISEASQVRAFQAGAIRKAVADRTRGKSTIVVLL
jgi:hypothetical protein